MCTQKHELWSLTTVLHLCPLHLQLRGTWALQEKWLITAVGEEMWKTNLNYFFLLEDKQMTKDSGSHDKELEPAKKDSHMQGRKKPKYQK